jgi:1,3-beta-glucan synthase
MSAHPQGGQQGQYDDGYGVQGQDAYYNDDQYGQYHDQQPGQAYDNQQGDAYYDEACVFPKHCEPAMELTCLQRLL